MKSHALYDEVHNFLKGKAPLFERELALIRNHDLHHMGDLGDSFAAAGNNSRKSSVRAAQAVPNKYQEKRT